MLDDGADPSLAVEMTGLVFSSDKTSGTQTEVDPEYCDILQARSDEWKRPSQLANLYVEYERWLNRLPSKQGSAQNALNTPSVDSLQAAKQQRQTLLSRCGTEEKGTSDDDEIEANSDWDEDLRQLQSLVRMAPVGMRSDDSA